LKEAYGSLAAFLYGWQRFWIGSPGSIAAYAVGSATFLSGVIPLGPQYGISFAGIFFIAVFTGLNCLSVTFGGAVQSLLTALKVLMVLGLAAGIFFLSPEASFANFHAASTEPVTWSAFGAAVLAALWAFDGWNNLPMAAGEVKNPSRNIPFALVVGTIAVILLYAIANASYFFALPFPEVVNSYSVHHPEALPVATKAAQGFIGSGGVALLSIALVISALGAMNGSILTSARVPYAMSESHLFPQVLGRVSAGARVPVFSVLIQGAWACVLALSGSFDQLTDYVVFSAWIFYAMNAMAVLILRRKYTEKKRNYRVQSFVPWLFSFVALALLANTLITAPRESGIGLAFIGAGIPLYFFFRVRTRR
ncbi:MAG: amino acid permease, partial [Pirellulaceae bacterium]